MLLMKKYCALATIYYIVASAQYFFIILWVLPVRNDVMQVCMDVSLNSMPTRLIYVTIFYIGYSNKAYKIK